MMRVLCHACAPHRDPQSGARLCVLLRNRAFPLHSEATRACCAWRAARTRSKVMHKDAVLFARDTECQEPNCARLCCSSRQEVQPGTLSLSLTYHILVIIVPSTPLLLEACPHRDNWECGTG